MLKHENKKFPRTENAICVMSRMTDGDYNFFIDIYSFTVFRVWHMARAVKLMMLIYVEKMDWSEPNKIKSSSGNRGVFSMWTSFRWACTLVGPARNFWANNSKTEKKKNLNNF